MYLKMSLQEIVIFKMSQNASTLFICGHFTRCLKEYLYNPSDTLFFKKLSYCLPIFEPRFKVSQNYVSITYIEAT
jgi:hypothetical protein